MRRVVTRQGLALHRHGQTTRHHAAPRTGNLLGPRVERRRLGCVARKVDGLAKDAHKRLINLDVRPRGVKGDAADC